MTGDKKLFAEIFVTHARVYTQWTRQATVTTGRFPSARQRQAIVTQKGTVTRTLLTYGRSIVCFGVGMNHDRQSVGLLFKTVKLSKFQCIN